MTNLNIIKEQFSNINTLEELKKVYRTLAKKYHPDCGGDNESMQLVNECYESSFKDIKARNNRKANVNEKGYMYTDESANDYINIINDLIKCHGLNIEICGYWLWVSGNTYEHRYTLKNLNFRYSKSKKSWYLNTVNNNQDTLKKWMHSTDMNTIRAKYGSYIIQSENLDTTALLS